MDETPLDEALNMKKKGYDKKNIADDLKNKGYDSSQVSNALNQMDIKNSVDSFNPGFDNMQPSIMDQDIPVPEPPEEYQERPRTISPQQVYQPSRQANYYTNQEELIESVVDEKWQQIVDSLGDIEIWKSNINDELTSIKQEILRLSGRLDNLQKAVLGKVNEYNQNISDVGVEIKALERVMQNILQPLTSNIRELSKVTEDIKRGKNL